MSRAQITFWRELGFDPFDSADWATMSVVAQDPEIAHTLEMLA